MLQFAPEPKPAYRWRHPTAFSRWGDTERQAIERVIDSGQFTMGPEVAAFEREFADYHGRAFGIMVNSGSSANLVATASLFHVQRSPLKAGDKALVPSIAWSTTYAPLVQHGLELVLTDADETWNADIYRNDFDPEGCRLVVGCSILGSPANLEGIRTAAGVLDAYMIEDNCESLGALVGDKRTGTFGDLSTFSFFWSHQLSAIEGGMILTDSDELANLCRMLRAHGWTRDVNPEAQGQVAGMVPFEREYDFRLFGYNVRPVEMHAAIARAQLRKLPDFVAMRQANLREFVEATAGLPIVHQSTVGGGLPSPFGLPFCLETPALRQKAVEALRRDGIDCRLPTGGSFRLHAYGARWRDRETPVADTIHQTGLFLGNPPWPIPDEVERIARVLKGAL